MFYLFIFSCSGMFRDVPECPGMFHVPGFIDGRLEIRNFSSRVEKYFTYSLRSLVKYFSTREEKFRICARSCNILYIFRFK